VGSIEAAGKIVVEYINMRDQAPWEETATLTIKGNKVMRVEGGIQAKGMEQALEENVRKFGEKASVIDSWHGGINRSVDFQVQAAYEAGPCGFGLYDRLRAHRIDVLVAPPSLMEESGNKIKTIGGDSRKLARRLEGNLLKQFPDVFIKEEPGAYMAPPGCFSAVSQKDHGSVPDVFELIKLPLGDQNYLSSHV
jgi:hypothetical protein